MSKSTDKRAVVTRGTDGKFAVGNSGKIRGCLDFMSVARKQAERTGVSLERIVESLLRSLLKRALAGDTPAAKLLLDRLCGTQASGSAVNVAIGVGAAGGPDGLPGPPPPRGQDAAEYIAKLNQIVIQQGNATAERIQVAEAKLVKHDAEADAIVNG